MVEAEAGPEQDRAREQGREAGRRNEGSGIDCPYGHDALPLRLAWFEGFSQGRTSLPPDGG